MTRPPRRDTDLVRAYVRTGGRHRPSRAVDLIMLVTAALPAGPELGPDARRVLSICRGSGVLSVAEVAAHLDLPPSVAKIVVADLLDSGHLSTPAPAREVPQLALLEEVLTGLRALSG
ncbi:DUF742 domain-containing protein [Nocardia thailandica]|uniref:DUF742 domain-containing protein n=1 Tax=Nocardia thailandica TaxID=257275 RepID=A0ABW6PV71_9NOCA